MQDLGTDTGESDHLRGLVSRCTSCGEDELALELCQVIGVTLQQGRAVRSYRAAVEYAHPAILFCPGCGVEVRISSEDRARLLASIDWWAPGIRKPT